MLEVRCPGRGFVTDCRFVYMTQVRMEAGAVHEAQPPQPCERMCLPTFPETTSNAFSDLSKLLSTSNDTFSAYRYYSVFQQSFPSRRNKMSSLDYLCKAVATMTEANKEKDHKIPQIEAALKEKNDQIDRERQERAVLAETATATVEQIEKAVVRIMVHLEKQHEIDASCLSHLAIQLSHAARTRGIPAGLVADISDAKGNVLRLADRSQLMSVDRIVMDLCNALQLHAHEVAQQVLVERLGGTHTELDLFRAIDQPLALVNTQCKLIQNADGMTSHEKRRQIDNLLGSIAVQLRDNAKFPFDTDIVPYSDIDLTPVMRAHGRTNLYDVVRTNLSP
jgi:hypothetical protein